MGAMIAMRCEGSLGGGAGPGTAIPSTAQDPITARVVPGQSRLPHASTAQDTAHRTTHHAMVMRYRAIGATDYGYWTPDRRCQNTATLHCGNCHDHGNEPSSRRASPRS